MKDVAVLIGSTVRDSHGNTGIVVAADPAALTVEFQPGYERVEDRVARSGSAIDTSYEILTTEGWKPLGSLAGCEDSLFRLVNELSDMLGEAGRAHDPHKRQSVNDDGPRGGTNIKRKKDRWDCKCKKGDPIQCLCKAGKRKRLVVIPLSYKNEYNPEYRAYKGMSAKAKAAVKKAGGLSKGQTKKIAKAGGWGKLPAKSQQSILAAVRGKAKKKKAA